MTDRVIILILGFTFLITTSFILLYLLREATTTTKNRSPLKTLPNPVQ
jgi:hypothetical protein